MGSDSDDLSEEIPVAGDINSIPLEGSLAVTESLTIGGSYDTSLGNRRIAFVASETMDSTIETMAEIPAVDPWTVTFSGTPPAQFFPEETDFCICNQSTVGIRGRKRKRTV